MRPTFKTMFALALSAAVFAAPAVSRADQTRDFIVSCSYGVLAGTLVGAATLAFSDKPGESLNKVARGASLGLYAGILLGLYVAYGPTAEDAEAEAAGLTKYEPPVLVVPLISDRGSLEGAAATATVYKF